MKSVKGKLKRKFEYKIHISISYEEEPPMSKKNTDFTSLLYQSVVSVSGLFSAGIIPLLFVMFEGIDMFDMLADIGGIWGANENPATYTLK